MPPDVTQSSQVYSQRYNEYNQIMSFSIGDSPSEKFPCSQTPKSYPLKDHSEEEGQAEIKFSEMDVI